MNARETEIMNGKTSHVTRVYNTIALYLTDNERWCIFSRYVCIENVEKRYFTFTSIEDDTIVYSLNIDVPINLAYQY